MDEFTLYANKNGVEWWRCNNCNYLTRGRPKVCPVCNGKYIEPPKSSIDPDKAIDNAIQQIKDIMEKYKR